MAPGQPLMRLCSSNTLCIHLILLYRQTQPSWGVLPTLIPLLVLICPPNISDPPLMTSNGPHQRPQRAVGSLSVKSVFCRFEEKMRQISSGRREMTLWPLLCHVTRRCTGLTAESAPLQISCCRLSRDAFLNGSTVTVLDRLV